MHIVILYATTEGQTRKIARFIQSDLARRGHTTELLPLAGADDITLTDYDGALLLASVHAGQYQTALATFATRMVNVLREVPHVFLSVSLSAAGNDPDDMKGLAHGLDVLRDATGWTPAEVWHVAGAFRFSEYNWFKTWAMRWIAAQKDPKAVVGEDVEYTDWDQLTQDLDAWTASLMGQQRAAKTD